MEQKFILSYYPLEDSSRTFITHIDTPVIIAEAFHFDDNQEAEWMELKRNTSVGASIEYPGELILIAAIYIDPIEANKQTADSLARFMSKMGDWYYKYLEWEDSN